jgi:CheY-like chemotaxis protein
MPDMDGFEVAAALRADPLTERVPILVVTSRDLAAADKERLSRHVSAILRKGDEAVDGLRQWLRTHVGEPPEAIADAVAGSRDDHSDLLPAGFVPAISSVALGTSSDGTGLADSRRQATR